MKYEDVPKCDDGSPDITSDEWNIYCGEMFWGMFPSADEDDIERAGACLVCGHPSVDRLCPSCGHNNTW